MDELESSGGMDGLVVVGKEAAAKTFVVANEEFPPVADAAPILKPRSRVLKRDPEIEGWLNFVEGKTLEAPSQVLHPRSKPVLVGSRAADDPLSDCLELPAHADRSHPLDRGTTVVPFPVSMGGGCLGSSSLEDIYPRPSGSSNIFLVSRRCLQFLVVQAVA